jgi:N-formylglutamate amidohydrolase
LGRRESGNNGLNDQKQPGFGDAASKGEKPQKWPRWAIPLSGAPHPDAACLTPPFSIARPSRQILPLVFDSPHSGRRYPPSLLGRTALDPIAIRRSEDCYVDELFAGVVSEGAPLLAAHFPRAYLDVNREPFELDPAMFSGPLPAHANTRSERVQSGLGTIARVVADGSEIYREKLAYEDAAWRIGALHEPYHWALESLISETQALFGEVVLVDCHSMPSPGAALDAYPMRSRADIVLGDRFGLACRSGIIAAAEHYFTLRGYRVSRNVPYAGGFICTRHGRPEAGRHALQIEVARSLYMSETRLTQHGGFARVAADMAGLAPALAQALYERRPEQPLAAE